MVFRYADEIFGIGRELMETLRGRPHRALEAGHLVCREDSTERLLVELATHALDVVITDMPAPATVRVKAFSHLLGESDTAFFAPASMAASMAALPGLAARCARGVPDTEHGPAT